LSELKEALEQQTRDLGGAQGHQLAGRTHARVQLLSCWRTPRICDAKFGILYSYETEIRAVALVEVPPALPHGYGGNRVIGIDPPASAA
jgi:hypothetical protein